MFEFLFAKQDMANIPPEDLFDLRQLAKTYAELTTEQFENFLKNGDWKEICDDHET